MRNWFFSEIKNKRFAIYDSTILSQLTIVIPSYMRHEYVYRSIIYWAYSSAKVIIVDGSINPLPTNVQDAIESIPNVKYIHEQGSISSRLASAGSYIETDYVVLMGDDEFHLKNGLAKAVEKLVNNDQYVGCIGQSIAFCYTSKGILYGYGYPHKNYFVEDEDSNDRLIYAMKTYNAATAYAVLTRDCWIKSYGFTNHLSSPYAWEIQQSLLTYSIGKICSVDNLYWLRSYDVAPVHGIIFNRKLSFIDWWRIDKYKNERDTFISLIATELSIQDEISLHEAMLIIYSAVDEYLVFCKHVSSEELISNSLLSSLYSKAKMIMPQYIKEFVLNLFGFSLVAVDQRNFEIGLLEKLNSCENLNFYGISQLMLDELREIDAMIVDFNHELNNS